MQVLYLCVRVSDKPVIVSRVMQCSVQQFLSLPVSHAFGFQSHASRPLSPHHQGLLFTTEGPHTISRQGSRPARPSLLLSLGSSSLQFYVESSLLSASQCTAGQGFSWIQSGIFNYCPCPVTCTFFMKLFLKWIYVLHFSEESLSAKAQFCVFWVCLTVYMNAAQSHQCNMSLYCMVGWPAVDWFSVQSPGAAVILFVTHTSFEC